MIPQNEIMGKAREHGVPVSTIERDYAQNWLLEALPPLPLVLKGGTSIRKVYIGDYRFSDDLDFTLLEDMGKDELKNKIEKAVAMARARSGINFSDDIEIQENENGFVISVYFQIMQRGESRTKIKIDITNVRNEKILLPLNARRVIHPYSDTLEAEIKTYTLEEIMGEKIRSLFQRTRPRDLYDVWYLWDRVERKKVLEILDEKFKTKNVKMDIKDFERRKNDFKNAWERSLRHQLKALPDFKEVFSNVFGKGGRMCTEMNREAILIGEIGALLHDIGKCQPNFIKIQSKENISGLPHHARKIDEFIAPELISYFKQLEVKLNNDKRSVYDLIKDHHDVSGMLLKCLEKCDKKNSADDKGIVRQKQHMNDTWISSPFGYPKERIDLDCLQKKFDDLQNHLRELFENYVSKTMNITCFRESLINNLKTAFSHALGETRIPANDVTLWDHSYSTASLFKSALAAITCGADPDPQNLKWRIFGICWDGLGFINKGRKIAEIQARSEIVENIKKELKRKFEDEIPIGNAIYEDTNGIYFTFPEFNNSIYLAKECAKIALEAVYRESKNELWPFFTLSRASETLTIIADELKFASEKRKIPKMTPTLFVEGKEEGFFENPEIATPVEGQDICPICRIRPKDVKNEKCDICEERRKGRLLQWLSNRQDTIWIDEVADKNNRITLISLNFYLDKWLDGTMIGTIYSQSFEDWKNGKRYKKKPTQNVLKDKHLDQTGNHKIDALNIAKWISNNPTKPEAKTLLECFMEDGNADNVPEDIKSNPDKILNWFFTQNPSPARLYRIWQETEEFFDLVVREIKNKIYSNKWRRIKFSVNYTDLKSKLKQGIGIEEKTPYIVQIDNLEPQKLLIFHDKNGEFYTIESLGKFKFNNKTGEGAVKEALKQGFKHLAPEDAPDKNLLNESIKPDENNIEIEEYYPLIEINKSPLSLRLIVPALDSIKIIKLITRLYNKRFEKVLGKLPLNVKLLVEKRKFPLYILLDAESRMLEGKEFKKHVAMNPWWDIDSMRNDKYYGFYPTKLVEEKKKHTLNELSSISKGKIFRLYPGYFDFELLLGTIDRYNIHYKSTKRRSKDYKLFTGRPYYFYQTSEMLELWDVLSSNLSSSQINFIEEMLTSKLREWRNVEDRRKQNVLREFAEATLKDVFDDKWNGLRDETRFFLVNSALNGFLLDTIVLFKHVIKIRGDENV